MLLSLFFRQEMKAQRRERPCIQGHLAQKWQRRDSNLGHSCGPSCLEVGHGRFSLGQEHETEGSVLSLAAGLLCYPRQSTRPP